jgi:hypothetical protein
MDFLRQEFLDAGGARQEKGKIVHKGFAIVIGCRGNAIVAALAALLYIVARINVQPPKS